MEAVVDSLLLCTVILCAFVSGRATFGNDIGLRLAAPPWLETVHQCLLVIYLPAAVIWGFLNLEWWLVVLCVVGIGLIIDPVMRRGLPGMIHTWPLINLIGVLTSVGLWAFQMT